MVILNRKNIILFLLLLSSTCYSAPQLVLKLDNTDSELGRPIRAELFAIDLKNKLSEINLEPLNKDFGVVTEYSSARNTDKRWPGKNIQILQLKLFPRHSGQLIVPVLAISNIQTLEKTITVTDNESASPAVEVSASTAYERQQIYITFTMISDNNTSRLAIKENLTIKGFDSTVLPFQRIRQQDGRYKLKIGWVASAFQPGKYTLALPPVEYSVNGVLRKYYYSPYTPLNIKNLPSYLSPTIPVGKIYIESKISPENLLQPNSLSYWTINIEGLTLNPYQLPPVLRQVKSNKKVKFLPVTTTRSTIVKKSLHMSTASYSIPFKALQNGLLKLPEIRVQYFDPDNSQLETLVYQIDSVYSLSIFWRLVIAIMLFILSAWLFTKIYRKWQRIYYSSNNRKQAIKLLENIQDIEGIRSALRFLAASEFLAENITTTQLFNYWERKYQSPTNINTISGTLNNLFYNTKGSKHDINNLATDLINVIENRRKIKS